MNRLFFTLALLFCFVSPSFCRDFGEKPLEPEAQAKLDALVEKLSDPSIKNAKKRLMKSSNWGIGPLKPFKKLRLTRILRSRSARNTVFPYWRADWFGRMTLHVPKFF